MDSAYFGAAGVVQRRIVINAGAIVASDATLSGVNIFFTGWTTAERYTDNERVALLNAVRNGMNLVVTSDDALHDISGFFGVTLDSAGSETNRAVLPNHPIMAGPFGRIVQYRGAGPFMGSFRAWPTGTLVLAASDSGASMILIPPRTITPIAGAVLLISDIDIMTTYNRALDEPISEPSVPVTDALVMNIVAFLCNPSVPASAPQLVFPQFATGQNNISSLNLSAAGPAAAAAIVRLRERSGIPFVTPFIGQGATTEFNVALNPNQSVTHTTTGTGALRTGWAAVYGPSTVGGNILFYAPGNGVTGVQASPIAGGFVMPITQQPTAGITPSMIDVFQGVAIANLSAKTNRVRLEIWDDLGRRGDPRFIDLPGYGQEARFLHELYPTFNFASFRGTLRITALNGLISAMGIQLGSSPGQFTALPIQPVYR